MPTTLRLHGARARQARSPHRRGWLSSPRRMFDLLAAWQERRRQRDRLQRLDDRLLKDIALTRADIEREIRKRFWRR
jgi:uncharacterized protein YjiS (DUF1127 family)